MPGKNGMETARALRKRGMDTILIFVTAIEEYVFQAFDVGAFHYLVKPFEQEKFAEVLRNAIKQKINKKANETEFPKKRISMPDDNHRWKTSDSEFKRYCICRSI